MKKHWPSLFESVQFKRGLMDEALNEYPWEDDEYDFDFQSLHPPIPDEYRHIRSLLESLRGKHPNSEDAEDCPFCRHRDLYPDPCVVERPVSYPFHIRDTVFPNRLNHPVWHRKPLPYPFHLRGHLWPDGSYPRLVTRGQLKNTKRYLNQLRKSRGYDVDCIPHSSLVAEVFTRFMISTEVAIMEYGIVLEYIELKTGKPYQMIELLNAVVANATYIMLTFTAAPKDGSSAPETFISTIDIDSKSILECLVRPEDDAPGPDLGI